MVIKLIDNLKKLYDEWNKKSISFQEFNDFIEIQTPFLDIHNDYIHLYLTKENNHFIISDDGHIFSELEMLGVDVTNTDKRKEFFNTKLRIFGVKFNSETRELFVSFNDINDYPQKQHNLLQCIIHISDMLLTSRSTLISIFTEEIKNFFEENDIIYTSDLSFTGKSGNHQTFDFVIPHRKKIKEKIIKAVNKPSYKNYQNIVFPFIDIRDVRPDSDFYVLANDLNEPITEKFKTSLNNWEVNVLAWSEKDKIIQTLKVV